MAPNEIKTGSEQYADGSDSLKKHLNVENIIQFTFCLFSSV